MEKPSRNKRVTGLSDHITSTISVTLVLFILGLVALVNITFSGIERQVKERVGFTAILADSLSQTSTDRLRDLCTTAPYVSSFRYMTADDVMAEQTGSEGDALVEMLGVNPYSPMLDIRVKGPWANPDSVAALAKMWSALQGVDEVSANTELVGSLDRNARVLNTVLLAVAAALLLISFVLINNTVRLTVYSRRFLIHTMKLVGATGGFIRRPFMVGNMWQGVVAGVAAGAMTVGATAWAFRLDAGLRGLLPWWAVLSLCGALVLAGVAICTIAAAVATNRYLRADYDDMFQ